MQQCLAYILPWDEEASSCFLYPIAQTSDIDFDDGICMYLGKFTQNVMGAI